MSKCQFIHVECWARRAPHKKNSRRRKACMAGVLAELIRAPDACPHVRDPKTPELIYGDDPVNVWEEAYALADQAVDAAGARLKATALVILVGVASYPVPRSIVEQESDERARFDRWRENTIAWLREMFGPGLRVVVGHWDEPYAHLHFAVLPTLEADRRLRIGQVHPGHQAEVDCREARGSRREQKQAHQRAMSAFQDSYYDVVVAEFGFARLGPRQQRIDRDGWAAQTKQLRALARARDRLAHDQQNTAATAAREVAERTAQTQREAAAQVAAIEAAAAEKHERMRSRALARISQLTAENGALNAEVKRRDAIVADLTQRLAVLEAVLTERDLGPEGGG
jgi:hypothetical protein